MLKIEVKTWHQPTGALVNHGLLRQSFFIELKKQLSSINKRWILSYFFPFTNKVAFIAHFWYQNKKVPDAHSHQVLKNYERTIFRFIRHQK